MYLQLKFEASNFSSITEALLLKSKSKNVIEHQFKY